MQDEKCVHVYRIDSLRFCGTSGFQILDLSRDSIAEQQSREHYPESTFTYTGYRKKFPNKMGWMNGYGAWSLVDCRITSIDIITLVDVDEKHPTGSSVTDLFQVRYYYRHKEIVKTIEKLNREGGLCLIDAFECKSVIGPEADCIFFMSLVDSSKPYPGKIEITFNDAFGHHIVMNEQKDLIFTL